MVEKWTLVIAPVAEKRILKIPNPDKRRILLAVNQLYDGPMGDLKPLKGREDVWRLRVGDWRVLMTIDIENHLIIVKYVDSRGDVYKH